MNVQEIELKSFDYSFDKQDGGKLKTNIDIVGQIISMMNRGYSPIIVVVGKQRTGKSFFALWLANIIHHYFHPDVPFDPTKLTFYDPIETISRIDEISLEPLIIDEAGAIFNTQEWYAKTAIAMSKIIMTAGFRGNFYIFIAPHANSIIKSYRRNFDFICHTISRGHIIVKQINKKYDEINDVKIKTMFYEKIRLKKKDLDPEIWAKYESYSISRKKEMHNGLSYDITINQIPDDPFGRKT